MSIDVNVRHADRGSLSGGKHVLSSHLHFSYKGGSSVAARGLSLTRVSACRSAKGACHLPRMQFVPHNHPRRAALCLEVPCDRACSHEYKVYL